MSPRSNLTPAQIEFIDRLWRAAEGDDGVPALRWEDLARHVEMSTANPLAVESRQIVPRVLSTVDPERTDWAWEERIPLGAVTILAGRQGLGKSTLLASLTADLTKGTLAGDLHGKPTTVLLASYEDSYAGTIVPRLIAAHADLTGAVGLDLMDEGKPDLLSLPADLELIAKTAKEYQAKVLVIDPLMAALPGGIDSHRDQDVRRALAPLGQLAAEADLAIVAVLHLRKGAANEALDRVSGSVAFTAAARSVLAFGQSADEDDETGRVLAHAKSNLGPLAPSLAYRVESATVRHGDLDIPTSKLVCAGETDVVAGELLSPPAAEDRSEVDIAADWLADHLGDGEWHGTADTREAAKADDIASRTLQRARARLGVESKRDGFPAKGSWRLSAVTPGPLAQQSRQEERHDSNNRSAKPNTNGSAPQSRQGQSVGTTGTTEVDEAERIAAKFPELAT
jgi:hypothetical protein